MPFVGAVNSFDDVLDGARLVGLISRSEAEEALTLFIQNNWTGPVAHPSFAFDFHNDQALKALEMDGECPYRLVLDPILLLIAKNYFKQHKDAIASRWLYLRSLVMHQRIMENPVAGLKAQILEILDQVKLEEVEAIFGPSIYCEISVIYQIYHEEKKAVEFLHLSAAKLNLQYSLTGVLGRRTKFQSFDTSQLVVQSSSTLNRPSNDATNTMPSDLKHNDDVLLEKISINETVQSHEFSHEQLAVLLNDTTHLLTFNARDETIEEKSMAYLTKILEKPNAWSVYTTALFYRSKLESHKARMIERATLQIQALVDQINLAEPEGMERMKLFFSIRMPSPWEMDLTQGSLFASLGIFKTALAVFTKRELWDEAISCMVQIGETKAAEERLMIELESCPSNSKLWCVLGDLKEDPSFYEKAWEVGGKRYARAKRALGNYNFKRQNWQEAVDAFETSLGLNPLFPKTWFLLGCSYIQLDDLKKALVSFSRVVSLDPDNADAWNNIATIHIKMDHPKDAMMALKEASRLDYGNWMIFDNYFQVAMSSGELFTATQALRRVAEIKEKDFQLGSLSRLVELLAKAIQFVGTDEHEIKGVRKRIQCFLEEVLVVHFPSSPDLWMVAYRFHQIFQDNEPMKQSLFKAYRGIKSMLHNGDKNSVAKLVSILETLVECVVEGKNPDELFQLELILQDSASNVERILGRATEEYQAVTSLQVKLSSQ
jgi:tetratricopeptide (TPR) repeat protein